MRRFMVVGLVAGLLTLGAANTANAAFFVIDDSASNETITITAGAAAGGQPFAVTTHAGTSNPFVGFTVTPVRRNLRQVTTQ